MDINLKKGGNVTFHFDWTSHTMQIHWTAFFLSSYLLSPKPMYDTDLVQNCVRYDLTTLGIVQYDLTVGLCMILISEPQVLRYSVCNGHYNHTPDLGKW